jgi:hypothetical protein
MTGVTQLFVVGAVLAAALSLISIWAPRRLPVKGTALAASALFLPLGYASLVDLLSKPKPVDLEWWLREAEEAEVLASRLVEGEGIYLWLQLPDVAEPRAYVLPWDRASAEQLQRRSARPIRRAAACRCGCRSNPRSTSGRRGSTPDRSRRRRPRIWSIRRLSSISRPAAMPERPARRARSSFAGDRCRGSRPSAWRRPKAAERFLAG